ncbi:MAG: flagellar brake protein [Thermoanaerobacteraceae bacterium]|nr:flagellar brake protein [Thermoanaerobacteraceae bacterium]
MLKNLKPGQRIEIGIGRNKKYYFTKVEDVSKDGTILIDTPIYHNHLVPIHLSSIIQIIFFNKNGQFAFDAEVINKFSGNLSFLQVKQISEITKIQRRKYYRLEKIIPFTYKEADDEKENFFTGLIKDISGEGFKAVIKHRNTNNSIIFCNIKLSDLLKEIAVKGKIIRCDLNKDRYEIGVQFVDINDKLRDQIITFIFEEERKYKKRDMYF